MTVHRPVTEHVLYETQLVVLGLPGLLLVTRQLLLLLLLLLLLRLLTLPAATLYR
jgi:hypothetical protein